MYCNTRVQTARKVHQCYECGRKIKPLEQYQYQYILDYGEPYVWKTCLSCVGWWEIVEELTESRRDGCTLLEDALQDGDGEYWTRLIEEHRRAE